MDQTNEKSVESLLDAKNRREWLRQVVIGAAGISAGVATGCHAGFMIDVICSGLMAFKLPRPGTESTIQIHIPRVDSKEGMKDGHVYKAGRRATSSDYTKTNLDEHKTYNLQVLPHSRDLARPAPPTLINAPVVFLHNDNDTMCRSAIPADGQKPFCIIKIPMPDVYLGYRFKPSSTPGQGIFKGTDADHCTIPVEGSNSSTQPLNRLMSTPLVHVFRYTNVTQAALDTPEPWTANGRDKLFIYAQPAIETAPSRDHFMELETYLGITLADLDFSDDSNLKALDQFDPGNSGIGGDDLRALYAFNLEVIKELELHPEQNKNGNLADCIGIYGS